MQSTGEKQGGVESRGRAGRQAGQHPVAAVLTVMVPPCQRRSRSTHLHVARLASAPQPRVAPAALHRLLHALGGAGAPQVRPHRCAGNTSEAAGCCWLRQCLCASECA